MLFRSSYLLPQADVPAIAAALGLPATADEWLSTRGAELDRRLKRFARRLRRGELDGVELRDGRLHVAALRAATSPEAKVLAALNHPNIAAIYGLEDRAIVMDLVEGPSLPERLASGRNSAG